MKISEMRRIANLPPGSSVAGMQRELNALLLAQGRDPGALYQELEMDAPYVNTHDDTSHADEVVQLHSHAFYELLLCRRGNPQYLLGTQRYRLQPGDIVYIPPGTSHRPLLLDQLTEPYDRDVLWLSAAFAQYLHGCFPGDGLLPPEPFVLRTAHSPWQERLGALFRAGIRESAAQNPGWQAAVCGNTTNLLVQLARARAGGDLVGARQEQQELLDRIVIYIEDHLAERITLADTARQFLVSQSSVNQLFRKRMNVSFYHFVIQRRLIWAKRLLQEGVGAEQISARVGFGDYSTFYRAFKREYGITPAEYRRLQAPQPPYRP